MPMKKLDFGKIADRFMPEPLRYYWDNRSTSPVGYRIAHGAFWSVMGTGIPQVFNLVSTVVAARLLGKLQYGEFGIINNTAGLFSIFAILGLALASTKHIAEFREKEPERAGHIIALFSLLAMGTAVLMAVLLIAIAPWLSESALAAPHLTDLLRIGVGIVIFGMINSVQMGALSGFEAFRTIARINTFYAIIALFLLAGGVYLFGLPGAVWAIVIAMGINCIISNIELRKEAFRAGVPISFTGCSKELHILVGFSLPAILAGMMFTPANWLCSAMLVNTPNGYAEMGIFQAASSWQKAILFLPQCLNMIALPMLADFHGAQKRRQYRKAFWYNTILVGASALGGAIMVSLASPFIMKIYGPSFESGSFVLVILSFSAFLTAIAAYIGVTMISQGRIWLCTASSALWALALIGSAYFLIPGFGALGFSLAMLLSYLLQALFMVLCAMKSPTPVADNVRNIVNR